MLTIVRGLLTLSLCGFTTGPALALTPQEAGTCVVDMAQEMQSLPRGDHNAYRRFAESHVDIDTITAAAVGRAWSSTTQKRAQWKEAALTEIVHDTIGTLRGIEIGKISRTVVRQAASKDGVTYFIVSGEADGIEVSVHVDANCRVRDAYAAQVRASERIRDRIQTMYPTE